MTMQTVCFKDSCRKTLSAVEASPARSNQHEFNGVIELQSLFGYHRFSASAIFHIEGRNTSCEGNLTWYDAREAHPTRTEYRLYFNENSVMQQAEEGDDIIIGFDMSKKIHVILIKAGSENYSGRVSGWQAV
ncbi:type II restriction endonuclease [Pectobacterium aroidearum]|uniref:type II restriction endonuclease n=1 Tax=Pectobacterium aroidearum TaxID=1201031 RepID=UPI0015DDACE0|nr:type II restriction endonuclease [Pectobacterium aroidearum]MBA0206249.1 type II restriction endonuclease [Pectobacterium aroidearum]